MKDRALVKMHESRVKEFVPNKTMAVALNYCCVSCDVSVCVRLMKTTTFY